MKLKINGDDCRFVMGKIGRPAIGSPFCRNCKFFGGIVETTKKKHRWDFGKMICKFNKTGDSK